MTYSRTSSEQDGRTPPDFGSSASTLVSSYLLRKSLLRRRPSSPPAQLAPVLVQLRHFGTIRSRVGPFQKVPSKGCECFKHEKVCLARFRPVQEFDVGDSDVFWQWEALLGHLQIGLVQGKTLLGFYSPGRLILLRCLHLQIPLGILATPHLFFSGGPSFSASFASRRIPFLSASFVSGLFSWGPLPQWHTPLCVCRGLTSVQRESPYTQPLRIAFE